MSIKRKICVVTGSRAEYGLLRPLMEKISSEKGLELQIVVTGMHLSHEFGYTAKEIVNDGFIITKKVEMLLSSDTKVAVTKSMGLGMIGFADVLNDLVPDLMILLGDRFEVFVAATAATIAGVPIAHLHGGELTEGAFDESFRHSITKMSHLHFVSTESYRQRVIQLGEQPKQVFNVGAIGIDSIKQLTLMNKTDLEREIGLKLGKRNFMVTFHPVTLEENTAQEQFSNLLEALEQNKDAHVIFTKSNADTDGRIINDMIDKYVASHSQTAVGYSSLGQMKYFSTLQYMDAVVGNSSSGLLEAPSFNIATINIGDRQRGRIKADSVIDCKPVTDSIISALKEINSKYFIAKCKSTRSPYGDGGTTDKIIKVINNYYVTTVLKKKFYDLPS